MENNTEGTPHEALFFVLGYLPVIELLVMSQVCRSLRDAVNNDVLVWLNVTVDRSLGLRLSDNILRKITSKANGLLRTLALVNCVKITNDGLLQVVHQNPLINRLHVPACTGLSPEGVIAAVKTLTKYHNLETLRIDGIYNIQKEHLETLQSHLQMNQQEQAFTFFHDYRNFSTLKHEGSSSPIDIELCPRCSNVRMVFDCPRESCKTGKSGQSARTKCRGCYFCIPRCEECGRCVGPEELEWAACVDILCSDCWFLLPKCSFCNKASCKRHANQCGSFLSSTGWVCAVCHEKCINGSCS
ncbi:F-box protein SKIP28 [Malania oleifera]|uniref:F-box protein SKIP28 n=1 Tax=Malania oleifera TaxID=397392 RepID=UPI0025ADC571|nr:F-box protein SKIP28 [Malania oleifera]